MILVIIDTPTVQLKLDQGVSGLLLKGSTNITSQRACPRRIHMNQDQHFKQGHYIRAVWDLD